MMLLTGRRESTLLSYIPAAAQDIATPFRDERSS
jgi:hypothetical protein